MAKPEWTIKKVLRSSAACCGLMLALLGVRLGASLMDAPAAEASQDSATAAIETAKATLAPEDFLVCTITLNSTDERDQLERRYSRGASKGRFTFLELTDLSEPYANGGWFQRACQLMSTSGLQCDQLVISGHFGGEFSGDTRPHRLSLLTLEQMACDQACSNVLNSPAEVFLLGCNTLSGKEQDSRTPEQYIQILMSHDDSRIEAERVADERYGSTQVSNRERMMSVFSNRQQIYGFDSVAPLGANISRSFSDYLNEIDPVGHLTTVRQKQLEETLRYINGDLEEALGANYNFCQVSSNPLEDSDPRALSCPLVSASSSRLTRLAAIEAILNSDHPERFVTLIEQSLQSAGDSLTWAGQYGEEEIATLARISASQGKAAYLAAIDESLRMGIWSRAMKLGDLALELGWLSPADYAAKLKKAMLELAKLAGTSTDSSTVSFLCEQRDLKRRPKINLSEQEIKALHLPSIYSLEVLACIANPDPDNPAGPYRTSLRYFSQILEGDLQLSATETQSLVNGLAHWYPGGLPDSSGAEAIARSLIKNPGSDYFGKAATLLKSPPLSETQAIEVFEAGISTRDAFTLLESCALLNRLPATPATRSSWVSALSSSMPILSSCLSKDASRWLTGLSEQDFSTVRRQLQQVITQTKDDDTRRALFRSYSQSEQDTRELIQVVMGSLANPDTLMRDRAIMTASVLAREDLTQEDRAALLKVVQQDLHLASNLQYYARSAALSPHAAIQLLSQTLKEKDQEGVTDWGFEQLAAATKNSDLSSGDAVLLAGLLPIANEKQVSTILAALPMNDADETVISVVYGALSRSATPNSSDTSILTYIIQQDDHWVPTSSQPLVHILQTGRPQDRDLAARLLIRADPRDEMVELAAITALAAHPGSTEIEALITHMQPLTFKARRLLRRTIPYYRK